MKLNKFYTVFIFSVLILSSTVFASFHGDSGDEFRCSDPDSVYCSIAEVFNSLFEVTIHDDSLVQDILQLIVVPLAGTFAIIVGILHSLKIFRRPYWVQPTIALVVAFASLATEFYAQIVLNIFRAMGFWGIILFGGLFFIGSAVWGRGTIHGIKGEMQDTYKRVAQRKKKKSNKHMRKADKIIEQASEEENPRRAARLKDEALHEFDKALKQLYKAEKDLLYTDEEGEDALENIQEEIRKVKEKLDELESA